MTLWLPPGGAGTEGRASLDERDRPAAGWLPANINTMRLDDFDLKNIGFIKIDVSDDESASRGKMRNFDQVRQRR